MISVKGAFFHIPKTAGKTISNRVEDSTSRYLNFHIPSSLIEYPCELTTVIRDPVDRIYSLYRYSHMESFEDFLEKLAHPVKWIPRSIHYEISSPYESFDRIEKNKYDLSKNSDLFIYCLDKLNVQWFIERNDPELLTLSKGFRVPGHVVANQWDYIENSVGHTFHFLTMKDVENFRVPADNKGEYSEEDKNKDLTPEAIEKIQKLCHKDYEHLSSYF